MADIVISGPSLGLNAMVPVNMLDPRMAADGSYNVRYEKGTAATTSGMASYNTTTALNSGDLVLATFVARISGTDYVIAVTSEKIYRYNFVNAEWSDITQSGLTMSSALDNPVSWSVISHDDTDVYRNDDTGQSHTYEHLVICDGGLSDIQRWAGEGEDDCAGLAGSDDYSGSGPHRALQVGATQNRLLLISPLEYDTSSLVWFKNEVRVRWPQIGKLESWTGTGSGAVDLRDTGGVNVWSAPLGTEYYVYQNNSIWNLRYVGGTAIFDPRPMIHQLGLLASHLLVVRSNLHYFVGSDYNVYAYAGGTQKAVIGDPIKKYLVRDLESSQLKRAWMALDVNDEWLWIFYVPDGGTYITSAYGYNIADKQWQKLDFSAKFTSSEGITSVSVLAGTIHETGDTYSEYLSRISLYEVSDAADATYRYGDGLLDTSRTLTSEITNATWCGGGTYLECATGAFLTDFTPGDIMLVEDGSLYTNTRYGSHLYSVADMSNTWFELHERDASLAVADTTATPASVPVSVFAADGPTYAESLDIIRTEDALVVGTSSGLLFAVDASHAGEITGTAIGCRHLMPVLDGGEPGREKLWPGLQVTARKPETTRDGQLAVYYRTSGFDSTDGWVRCDSTILLDGTWSSHNCWVNRTSKCIQFSLQDLSGSTFEVREVVVLEPELQGKV